MKMQENKIYFDGTEMFFTVMEKNEVTPYVLNNYNIFLKQSPSKLTSNKLEKFKVLGTLNEEIYNEAVKINEEIVNFFSDVFRQCAMTTLTNRGSSTDYKMINQYDQQTLENICHTIAEIADVDFPILDIKYAKKYGKITGSKVKMNMGGRNNE